MKLIKGCFMAVGVIVVLVVVIIVVVAAAGNKSSSSSPDTTGTVNPAVQPGSKSQGSGAGPSRAGAKLIDHKGTGQWDSPTFTAPDNWTIKYSYDCSGFGSAGNFQVSVEGGNPGFSTAGVNELKKSGSGTTSVHDASGPGVYLSVNSECDWHIQAIA